MKTYSIEDPVECQTATHRLPPGNPLKLQLSEVVITTNPIVKGDGSVLPPGSEVVIRGITSAPTVYVATIEPMGVAGTTGEYLDIQLALLARKTKTVYRQGKGVARMTDDVKSDKNHRPIECDGCKDKGIANPTMLTAWASDWVLESQDVASIDFLSDDDIRRLSRAHSSDCAIEGYCLPCNGQDDRDDGNDD